jgi:hypothetical protein
MNKKLKDKDQEIDDSRKEQYIIRQATTKYSYIEFKAYGTIENAIENQKKLQDQYPESKIIEEESKEKASIPASRKSLDFMVSLGKEKKIVWQTVLDKYNVSRLSKMSQEQVSEVIEELKGK